MLIPRIDKKTSNSNFDPQFITDIMKKMRIQERIIKNPPTPNSIPFKQDTAFCLNLHQGKEFCEHFFNSFNFFVNKPPIYSEGRVGVGFNLKSIRPLSWTFTPVSKLLQ
jgi:hypothetical protein